VIKFENVTKVYPKSDKPALDNISIDVEKGEFVFLVGLSGSGKSTFLRLVLREEKPTSGNILVAGKDLNTLSNWKVPQLRMQVGTVFQDFRLLPNKTVAENVAFTLHVLGFSRKKLLARFRKFSSSLALKIKPIGSPESYLEVSSRELQSLVLT